MQLQHLEWKNVRKDVLNDKLSRQVVTGERIMAGKLFMAKGAVIPLHHHEAEQMSVVLQGTVEFDFSGEIKTVHAEEVVVIPSNVPHKVTALEDSVAMDFFSPIRQDWLDGSDSYLRK